MHGMIVLGQVPKDVFFSKSRNMRNDLTYLRQKTKNLIIFSCNFKFHDCPSSLRYKEMRVWT